MTNGVAGSGGGGERVLDLTKDTEDQAFGTASAVRVATSTKTIEEEQEKVRGRLAQWLVAAVVVLILFLAGAVAADWLTTEQVKSLSAVTLSPLIGLAGTAAGFYFGQKK